MQIESTNTPEQLIMQVVADCKKNRTWGQLQIDFRAGHPVVLRISETKIIDEKRNNYYDVPRN